MALTFHGAGEPPLATSILQILKAHQAQATVMAVGTWLSANPSFARTITDAGHASNLHQPAHFNRAVVDFLTNPPAEA